MWQFVVVTALALLAFLLVLVVAPKGWRTIVFNGLSSLPLIGAQVGSALDGFDWSKVLTAQAAAWAGLVILVLNIWLRFLTSTSVGKSE